MRDTTFHKGDRVVYVPFPGGPREHGTITSMTDRHAFVRYGDDTGSKATPLDLLEEAYPCGHEECGGCDPGAGWTFNEHSVTVATPTSAPDRLCIVGEMNGKPHEPHDWWYTAWGGGHQCDHDITNDPREKRVKAWHCPGIEATS